MTAVDKTILVLVAAILLASALYAILGPAFEARTYNKFKAPDAPAATYWDAVWADLRVTTN